MHIDTYADFLPCPETPLLVCLCVYVCVWAAVPLPRDWVSWVEKKKKKINETPLI